MSRTFVLLVVGGLLWPLGCSDTESGPDSGANPGGEADSVAGADVSTGAEETEEASGTDGVDANSDADAPETDPEPEGPPLVAADAEWVTIPFDPAMETFTNTTIWAHSQEAMFFGGFDHDVDRPAIYAYDGVTWTPMALPPEWDVDCLVVQIEATGPDDVWATIAQYESNGQTSWTGGGGLLHYDGEAWETMTIPGFAPDTMAGGMALDASDTLYVGTARWGPSPVDPPPGGEVFGRVGNTFQQLSIGLPQITMERPLVGDGWLAVFGKDFEVNPPKQAVQVYDGETWVDTELLAPAEGAWWTAQVVATPSGTLWAAGYENLQGPGHEPHLRRFDGGTWNEVDAFGEVDVAVDALAAQSDELLWLTGNEFVSESFPQDTLEKRLYTWDGDTLTPSSLDFGDDRYVVREMRFSPDGTIGTITSSWNRFHCTGCTDP